jgi:hypothetical protein
LEELVNSLNVVENYIEDQLSEWWVDEIPKIDHQRLSDLVLRLGYHCDRWFSEAISTDLLVDADYFFPIRFDEQNIPWQVQLDNAKSWLLYFPRVAVPDPVDIVAFPYYFAYSIARERGITHVPKELVDELRPDLKAALEILIDLRPFLVSGDIALVPPSVGMDDLVQKAAKREINTVVKSYSRKYAEVGLRQETLEDFACKAQVSYKLGLIPVATSEVVRRALRLDFERSGIATQAVSKDASYAQAVADYGVPALRNITFREVLRLRRNEEAFADWRSALGSVVTSAMSGAEGTEEFRREFDRASLDLLKPRIEVLNGLNSRSSALDHVLLPSAASFGAYFFATKVVGTNPDAIVTALATAGMTPVTWLVQWLHRRYNQIGRKSALLGAFYGSLVDPK